MVKTTNEIMECETKREGVNVFKYPSTMRIHLLGKTGYKGTSIKVHEIIYNEGKIWAGIGLDGKPAYVLCDNLRFMYYAPVQEAIERFNSEMVEAAISRRIKLLGPTAMEAAIMAQHSYTAGIKDYNKVIVGEWILHTVHDVPAGKDGIKMPVYRRKARDEYVIANRGTEFLNWNDWENNFKQPFGDSVHLKASIEKAKNIVENIRNGREKFTMVGHSKGGGEAIANAVRTNTRCIVFNPAAVNLTAYDDLINLVPIYTADMKKYIVKGDALDNIVGEFRETVGSVIWLPSQHISSLVNHSMESVIKALQKTKL